MQIAKKKYVAKPNSTEKGPDLEILAAIPNKTKTVGLKK